jgi:beta-glucanase (GH16 family)
MASLRVLLGLIPSTSKIEQAEKALITEFEKLHIFSESDVLARYNKLNGLVNSSDFLQRSKEIKSLRYKNSEEYLKEKEFFSLRKAKDIVLYFKTKSENNLKRFKDLEGTEKITDYETLEKYIKSPNFREKQKMKPFTFKDTDEYRQFDEYKSLKRDPEIRSYLKSRAKDEIKKTKTILKFEELDAMVKSSEFLAKKNMRPITFKDTEEFKKLLEYKRLKSSLEIKEFYKFKTSKEYANFLNTDGSTRLKRYNELKEYITTTEFKQRKEYLLDKKRYEKADLFRDAQEYEKLKKDPEIIWYFKVKDSDKFDILKSRELTFSDEFDKDKMDTRKWLTNYYWGEKLLKDRYSVESDLQFYTEKENFEIRNSLLKINTIQQKAKGRVWSVADGFTAKEFGYTSGLINSAVSFRQKYGIFSAKIRLGDPNARNAFWLLADKITPHIDICRTSGGKVWFDFFTGEARPVKTKVGSRYSNEYFIFTLVWTADKMVWKINGVDVLKQTSNVPQDPMYVNLAGGVYQPLNGITTMEIDWIRVYQFKN